LESITTCYVVFCLWSDSPQWAKASLFTRYLDHTQRRTTVGRTPLDGRPLPENTQHSQQTSIHAPGRIRTHNLSRRAAADLRLGPARIVVAGLYFTCRRVSQKMLITSLMDGQLRLIVTLQLWPSTVHSFCSNFLVCGFET
jgi:hypothetical protein